MKIWSYTPLNISVTKDVVTIFDRKHPLFLLESTPYVDVEKFILVPDLDTLKGHQTCFAENVSINQILYKYEWLLPEFIIKLSRFTFYR